MGMMPHWFAKTKEMAAFDRYFSTVDVDEATLRDRYLRALDRLHVEKYFTQADALRRGVGEPSDPGQGHQDGPGRSLPG